jgi:hypothetical protein
VTVSVKTFSVVVVVNVVVEVVSTMTEVTCIVKKKVVVWVFY